VLEAIDSGETGTLREELGDLLLQVLMHSAIAMEADGGFDIGDVADDVRAKMIHRHPHVFGDVAVDGPAGVVVNWEKLKTAEKRERLSLLDGVPAALPALAHAQGCRSAPRELGSTRRRLLRLPSTRSGWRSIGSRMSPAAWPSGTRGGLGSRSRRSRSRDRRPALRGGRAGATPPRQPGRGAPRTHPGLRNAIPITRGTCARRRRRPPRPGRCRMA